MIRYIFYTLLLVLGLGLSVRAQYGSISGKATNERNEPVVGGVVTIKSINKHTITDEAGNYTLKQVPFGQYFVELSAMDVAAKPQLIKLDKTTLSLDFKAKSKDSRKLKEVGVAAKSAKKKMETSGFAVNVIATKDAASRNLQTNELLDRTVGVRVLQSGGLGSEVRYNLNGMSGRSIGIFIDGIELSTYGTSFNLNSIPPALIERIEVYKGVLPAHLSGDLLGGAINIILNKGAATNHLSLSSSYGSFNTSQSTLNGMYRNAKNGFTLKGSGFHTFTNNDYEVWGKFSKYIEPNGVVNRNFRAKRFWDDYRAVGARLEAGFTGVKWADALLLAYNISDDYKQIQHGQTMGTPYMGRFRETNAHVLNLQYSKRHLFTRGLDLSFNGVYSDRNTYLQDTVSYAYNWDGQVRRDLNGKLLKTKDGAQQGAPTMSTIDRQIGNMRTNLSYEPLRGHKISVNHVYYTVKREDTDLLKLVQQNAVKANNELSKHVFAFNYEALSLKKRLISNAFLKYYQQNTGKNTPIVSNVNGQSVLQMQHQQNKATTWGYGLALSYALSPRIMLMSSAERAVRMPDGNEIFGDPAENILANAGLKPEISDNLNIGVKLGNFDWDQHRISLSTNLFWRNTKDKILRRVNQLLNDSETEVAPYVNLGLAQSLGFEGELSYSYRKNLQVMLNFSKFNSLFKERYDPITGQQYTYYNQQIPNEPYFTVNGNIQYGIQNALQKGSTLNLFYTLGYVGQFKTIWPESEWFITPSQLAQNLGLSYVFPNRRLTTSFDLKNIFNAEIYDNYGVQKPGRAMYFKLNYTINKF